MSNWYNNNGWQEIETELNNSVSVEISDSYDITVYLINLILLILCSMMIIHCWLFKPNETLAVSGSTSFISQF